VPVRGKKTIVSARERERESLREKISSEREFKREDLVREKVPVRGENGQLFQREREREREFKREDFVREKVPVRGKISLLNSLSLSLSLFNHALKL